MEELDVGKKDLKVNKKDALVSDFGKDLFKPKFDENINTWDLSDLLHLRFVHFWILLR